MSYSAKEDVELAFGRSNVRKWADIDNTSLQEVVDARVAWAIEQADSELDSKLANSQYQFPLADDSEVPPILARMSSYLAGVLLYESRGVTDVGERGQAQHALMWHRKRVDEFVRDVWGRRVELLGVTLRDGAVANVAEAPQMVCFPDPAGDRASYVTRLDDDMIGVRRP